MGQSTKIQKTEVSKEQLMNALEWIEKHKKRSKVHLVILRTLWGLMVIPCGFAFGLGLGFTFDISFLAAMLGGVLYAFLLLLLIFAS